MPELRDAVQYSLTRPSLTKDGGRGTDAAMSRRWYISRCRYKICFATSKRPGPVRGRRQSTKVLQNLHHKGAWGLSKPVVFWGSIDSKNRRGYAVSSTEEIRFWSSHRFTRVPRVQLEELVWNCRHVKSELWTRSLFGDQSSLMILRFSTIGIISRKVTVIRGLGHRLEQKTETNVSITFEWEIELLLTTE